MNDMNISELTTRRLAELIGIVLFRVSAVGYAIACARNIYLLALYVQYENQAIQNEAKYPASDVTSIFTHSASLLHGHTSQVYLYGIFFDALMAVIVFVFAGFLSRNICSGLFLVAKATP
jgi:hypothetical protein